MSKDISLRDSVGANLVVANLDGTNLDGASLDGASLVGASGYTLPDGWQIVNGIVRQK